MTISRTDLEAVTSHACDSREAGMLGKKKSVRFRDKPLDVQERWRKAIETSLWIIGVQVEE